MKRKLWVVEKKIDGEWEVTANHWPTRKDGREELIDWRDNFPDDKFRLMAYVPEKE